MKKIIVCLLAMIMITSAFSISIFAKDTTKYTDEIYDSNYWDSHTIEMVVIYISDDYLSLHDNKFEESYPDLNVKEFRYDLISYGCVGIVLNDPTVSSVTSAVEYLSDFEYIDEIEIPNYEHAFTTVTETTNEDTLAREEQETTTGAVVTDETDTASTPRTGDVAIYAVIASAISATIVVAIIGYKKKYNN